MDPPPKMKVSLAFGKSKISTNSSSAARTPPKPLNGVKRPRAALHDDSDSDGADESHGQTHDISHFDQAAGGAIHTEKPSEKNGPLVIPTQPNHDRLGYKRRRKYQTSALPDEAANDVVIEKTEVVYGLTIPERRVENGVDDSTVVKEQDAPPKKELTEDKVALAALLGKQPASTKTIPVAGADLATGEEEAFKRDYEEAQNAPTLEDYMAIPPSEFGAACLRGMGWKDTETLTPNTANDADNPTAMSKPRVLERRPALLGVGAKPAAAIGVEIGEWGKAAKGGKNRKAPESYNPVVLKNKKTGEVITEAELKARTEGDTRNNNNELILHRGDEGKRGERRRDDDRDIDRRRDRDKDRDGRQNRSDWDGRRDREYEKNRRDKKYRDRSSSMDRDRKDDRRRSEKSKRYRSKSRSRSPTRDRERSRKYDDRSGRDDKYYKSRRYEDDGYDRKKERGRSDRDYKKSRARHYD